MAINLYDQAARRLVTLDSAGLLRWLLPGLEPRLRFTRWLDTRNLPLPGEGERICDTVAELTDTEGLSPPWALLLELFTRPDPDATDRLLEYLALARRRLRHGPHQRDRYQLGAAVIYLTGTPTGPGLEMALPGQSDVRLSWQVRRVALAEQDAVALLDAVRDNRCTAALLPWAPLMQGGDRPEVLAAWKELAGAGADEVRRRILGSLAVVFADLTDRGVMWRQGLEDWNVELGPIAKEWWDTAFAKGEVKERRALLLRLLATRFSQGIPVAVTDKIQAEASADRLVHWFDQAAVARTAEEFCAGVGN